ncbi:MAG: CRISPR system precrRNA processing endoribonuclease RAMP protein Cas6 [Bryobacteraceae bacterium]
MKLQFFRLRFEFSAKGSILFPPGKAGNIVRGAFGTIFRRIACVPTCDDVAACEIGNSCPYALVFEPRPSAAHPSGFSELPRPFVFRAAHLDGRTVAPGEGFYFDIHLFAIHMPVLPYFVLTFAQLAREGIGPGRGAASLRAVDQLDLAGGRIANLFDGATFQARSMMPSVVELAAPASATRLRVRFVTPTEIKSGHEPVSRPEFSVLYARLRDRISILGSLYGDGPLDIDFRAAQERATHIRLLHCDLRHEDVQRRSSRTGRYHSIGGFARRRPRVGEVVYEGELGEFVPYLEAGKWIGVGRQTVWGKGELDVECPNSTASAVR